MKKKGFKLGEFEVFLLSFGTFKLDGGAMFGVVPKVLWSKNVRSDRKNRITLGLNLLLIKTPMGNFLVDTGTGDKYTEKEREIYGIKLKKEPLKTLGLNEKDINYVILTHLHFDHAGGATQKEKEKIVPTYPKAKYFVQKKEFEDAMEPNERTRASYYKENFVPLKEHGLLEIIEGDLEIVKGIKVIHTGGHTRGHQFVIIESKGEKAIYFGDIVPTSYHVPLPYIMGYDTYPMETLEIRKKYYQIASREKWLCFFEHDPVPKAGFIKEENGKFYFEELKP